MKTLFTLFLIFLPVLGHAYSIQKCHGDWGKWNSNPVTFKRLPISFPEGSNAAEALLKIEDRISSISGSYIHFADSEDNDNTLSYDGDGNEIAFVGPDNLDGFGHEQTQYSTCFLGIGDYRITESDVFFASPPGTTRRWHYDDPWPRSKYSDGDFNFQVVAMHELLHALGYKHDNSGTAIINSRYTNGGWYYGTMRTMVHGDDREGLQHYYEGEGATPKTDIAAINFFMNGERAELVAGVETTSPVPAGSNVIIQFNFGNVGDVAVDFDLCFFLSQDRTLDTETDYLIDCDRWHSGSGMPSYGTIEEGPLRKNITVPRSAARSTQTEYFVLVCADPEDEIDEVRESNNCMPLPNSITVLGNN